MFLINKDANEAISIPQRSFSDLDFKERRNLQEWIDKDPDILMWLMGHNVNIKCIKVTPYQNNNDIFLDTEQVLPAPDTESFQIKLNLKK